MFAEMKCRQCGKIFFPTPDYVYKDTYCGRTKWFCKYTCLLRYREQHEHEEKKKRERK